MAFGKKYVIRVIPFLKLYLQSFLQIWQPLIALRMRETIIQKLFQLGAFYLYYSIGSPTKSVNKKERQLLTQP